MIRKRVELRFKKITVLGDALFSVANILILVISIISASFLHNFVTIRHVACIVRLGELLMLRGRGVCIKFPGGAGIIIIDVMSALTR
jgi:hypothetical protein